MIRTVAHITDIHLDEQHPIDLGVEAGKNLDKILRDVNSRKINEIIFGGDIGASSAYNYFFNTFAGFNKNLKITLGNHDLYKDVKKYFQNNLVKNETELFYKYEDNFFKYIFLDSSSGKISPLQLNWLDSELGISEKKNLLFIHHPVLAVNTPIDKEYPLHNRNEIKEILLTQKNKVNIFCGHYHMDDETEEYNIKQYITPAASYQAVKEAETLELNADIFGYRIINFIHDQIKTGTVWFKK